MKVHSVPSFLLHGFSIALAANGNKEQCVKDV